MRQSNGYIITFTVILTIVCAGVLAFVFVGLKDQFAIQEELDKKTKILGAVGTVQQGTDVLKLYDKKINGIVVDSKGNLIEEADAANIDPAKEFKKPASEKRFPVYKYMSDLDSSLVEAYIVPVYGNGLWDAIWGYVALEPDLKTIKGAVYDHKGETPGLGARITTKEVQKRYEGKEMPVEMLKGEGNPDDKLTEHTVDGMSGSTMTANGMNQMLQSYFEFYQPYFTKERKENKKKLESTNTGSSEVNHSTDKMETIAPLSAE